MPSLDFDGEYGQSYSRSIRHSIPGYDVLHEIAIAAVRVYSATARRVLVVGPGPGEQLTQLLSACPKAQLFVLEPSQQMLNYCKKSIERVPGQQRCILKQGELDQATLASLNSQNFDLVICHNVLHLYDKEKQMAMLKLLADVTAVGGELLLSGYSEPEQQGATEQIMDVGLQRLRDRGLTDEQVDAIRTTRNKVVFSMDQMLISRVLKSENISEPLLLYQGLFSRLWISSRK